ncbi:MAG: hypothetical protein AAGH42_06535 [Pseudomonadota bacterium]
MVFPKRKPSTKKPAATSAQAQAKTTAKAPKKRGSFFKRKTVDEPVVAPETLAVGLSRALRTANMPRKAQEDAVQDTEHVRHALIVIEAILYAMDQARETITQCSEIIESAKLTEDLGGRAMLAENYDDLRLSLDKLAETDDEVVAELISAPGATLDLALTGRARYSIAGFCLGTDDHALNLPPPLTAFAADDEIEHTQLALDHAAGRVTRATASYCRDAKFLMACIGDLNKKLAEFGMDALAPVAQTRQTAAE